MAMEYDRRRPRIQRDVGAKIDAVRDGVPFERWVHRALEQALGDASPVFPIESENLAETPAGRVVAADPERPVRYEQKRGPSPVRRDNAALGRQAALNKAKGL